MLPHGPVKMPHEVCRVMVAWRDGRVFNLGDFIASQAASPEAAKLAADLGLTAWEGEPVPRVEMLTATEQVELALAVAEQGPADVVMVYGAMEVTLAQLLQEIRNQTVYGRNFVRQTVQQVTMLETLVLMGRIEIVEQREVEPDFPF